MDVGTFLEQTTTALAAVGIASARLDAQVLLSEELGRDKSWLLAHPEFKLDKKALESLQAQVSARVRRIPLAYIVGRQEFYGRPFVVNANVLVPRPETESLIELIKKYVQPGSSLLDVGTGSGIIAITAALEVQRLAVEACDISPEALKVAVQNAALLGARVRFFKSDLLDQAGGPYTAIVANLPYVAPGWPVSPETAAEPQEALYADEEGLALIYRLIAAAPTKLAPGGYLLLEADPRQHAAIKNAAAEHRLTFVETVGFALSFKSN